MNGNHAGGKDNDVAIALRKQRVLDLIQEIQDLFSFRSLADAMTSPPFDFASWPPALTQPQLEALTLYATSYALSHGLMYLPPADRQPIVPNSAIHAPISLFPSPVPRKLFEQGQRIQRTYNVLYSRIAMDEQFLDDVMGTETGVGKVDDFIGQLWRGWKKLRDDGHAPVRYDF